MHLLLFISFAKSNILIENVETVILLTPLYYSILSFRWFSVCFTKNFIRLCRETILHQIFILREMELLFSSVPEQTIVHL